MRLDPATYWRLRYLQAEGERAAAIAAVAELRYQQALWLAGINPAVPYRWDDATTSLIGQEAPCEPDAVPS